MEKCSSLIEAMGRLQNLEKLSGTATIFNGPKCSHISVDNWYTNNREDLTDKAKEALINASTVLMDVEQIVNEEHLYVSVHTIHMVQVYITVSGAANIDLSSLMQIAKDHTVELDSDNGGEINASILYNRGDGWDIIIEVYNIQH